MNRITDLETIQLPSFSDAEARTFFGKGWTYSNIYSLRELRDVYIVLKDVETKTLKNIYKEVQLRINSEYKTWKERRVLEFLNALVNFNLINPEYEYLEFIFNESKINQPITEEEARVFKNIFFTYFRFKEISSWFINPSEEFHKNIGNLNSKDFIESSKPIFYFSNSGRFIDSFLINDEYNKHRYIIHHSKSHLMRFWDVYIAWGTALNIIEKFSLSAVNKKVDNEKILSIAYFIVPFQSFDLINYIATSQVFDSRVIFIPELIFNIAKTFRYPVKDIKRFLVDEISINDNLTFERTSEIFIIKGKQSQRKIEEATYLYPKINDNYISHLIVRR